MRRPKDPSCGALHELLNHPALWRASDHVQQPTDERTYSSGFVELDRCLVGGGWPTNALVEILHGSCGIGELSLMLPAMAQVIRDGRWLLCVMPPYRIAAPAMSAHGIEPERVLVIRDCSYEESIWACEQAMRSGACGGLLIWTRAVEKASSAGRQHGLRALRRLQLAASAGNTLAVLFRDVHARTNASAAVVRMQLHPRDDGLDVELFKSRGGRAATVHVRLQQVVPTTIEQPGS
ncbi:MAG: hypothetical protein ACI8W7_002367 [Gammaproteobacteria bacterium]|jgi:hypothetical protein